MAVVTSRVFTAISQITEDLTAPGLGPWVTGIPEIDEVLAWYRTRYPVLAVA